MASYDTGYEDERFQHPVGQSFHCGICYNVVKDPTMCRHNEHLFCRACITRSLGNSETCPACVEPLTVETLTQPSRTVKNLLSELKIRCQFFNRGCEKFIELGNLERHVADCGFAPAVCSNEGCRVEVNKQDLLHHETAVCELRRFQCHSCKDIRQEMDIVKVNLAALNVRLLEVGKKLDTNEKRAEERLDKNQKEVKMNVKAMKESVVAKVELVCKQLNRQEKSNRLLQVDNREVKKCLDKMAEKLENLTQQTSHQVLAAQEHGSKGRVVVVGGWSFEGCLSSVEVFSLSNATWKPIQSMKRALTFPSSFVHNNQIFVSGGYSEGHGSKSIQNIPIDAVNVDKPLAWEVFPAELSAPMWGHCCAIYNGRLLVTGGHYVSGFSDKITEILLVPPYTRKLLSTMSVRRWLHCVLLFDGKMVILGGRKGLECNTALKSVLMYDIAKNKCQELAPLPYPVSTMAAVKWGDDNVIIMGGSDSDENPLNKVLIYNIKTQKSHVLPDMKNKRNGCVAAVVRDTVIVMGGQDEKDNLKSVESFRFDRFTWEELPEMQEDKSYANAVVC